MEANFFPRDDVHGPHLPILLHYNLLTDPHMKFFIQAIDQVVKPDMKVLELGCGSGILSLKAAQAGAHVLSIDYDTQLVEYANHIATQHNLEKQIRFQHGDAEQFTTTEKFDVIICEMQDTACIRERQIQVMNRALDFLTNSGTVLSLSIRNQISVVMTDYDFFGLHLPLPFFDTTEVISPRQRLSAPLEYQKISFMESNDPKFSQKLQIPITHTGTINSIMIETITEIAPGISCGGSDWFNAPYVVPLQKSLQVTKGDCISLTLSYIMGEGLKSFSFSNVVHN